MKVLLIAAVLLITGCNKDTNTPEVNLTITEEVTSQLVKGVAGEAGDHTQVLRDSQGNIYGYYEYLPVDFNANTSQSPLIFYWNGGNTITGDGREDLIGLLNQGLPQVINEGNHYPAIIISAMMSNWKAGITKPFVDYILTRYQGQYDPQRVYMTGFSAGGGLTVRHAARYPQDLTAIAPIAAAVYPPAEGQPSQAMAELPSWMFHNSGDQKVPVESSTVWHDALVDLGGEHKLTLYDSDSHYAWRETYANEELWQWLLEQRKTK